MFLFWQCLILYHAYHILCYNLLCVKKFHNCVQYYIFIKIMCYLLLFHFGFKIYARHVNQWYLIKTHEVFLLLRFGYWFWLHVYMVCFIGGLNLKRNQKAFQTNCYWICIKYEIANDAKFCVCSVWSVTQ